MTHDVIIVGARCAGAMLGTLLAKAGLKTLMLEADPPATDMPMSTHFIQPRCGTVDPLLQDEREVAARTQMVQALA